MRVNADGQFSWRDAFETWAPDASGSGAFRVGPPGVQIGYLVVVIDGSEYAIPIQAISHR